jgi:hypothetical protein
LSVALKLQHLDRALTDKERPFEQYKRDAERILEGETIDFHMADGGYSRLTIGWGEGPVINMDYGLSRPKAIKRFKEWKDEV